MPFWRHADIPPFWLGVFCALSWAAGRIGGFAPVAQPLLQFLAGLLVGGGAVLAVISVAALRVHGARVDPHATSAVLVDRGPFRLSRNPVYLGFVAILAGWVLWRGVWPALFLVPIYLLLVQERFVRPEESRLAARFGPDWQAYAERTRRWI